jgi:hypothetical protein
MRTVCAVLISGLGFCVTAWLAATWWPALAPSADAGETQISVEDLAWQLAER